MFDYAALNTKRNDIKGVSYEVQVRESDANEWAVVSYEICPGMYATTKMAKKRKCRRI